MKAFVYNDPRHCNASVVRAAQQFFGLVGVEEVTAADIIAGRLEQSPALFIIPGGQSWSYADRLNGAGNREIKKYLAAGGCYMGICAGAYYACQKIQWKMGSAEEISVHNELVLLKAVARGPIGSFLSADGFWASSQIVVREGGERQPALYWGGPQFEIAPEAPEHEVWARYAGLPAHDAAVVYTPIGAGHALLMSPHLEINDGHLSRLRASNPPGALAGALAKVGSINSTRGLFFEAIEELLGKRRKSFLGLVRD